MEIEHKHKELACKVLVVPGNGSAVLGMPDNELLDILNVRLNTMDTPKRWREINAQELEWEWVHKQNFKPL